MLKLNNNSLDKEIPNSLKNCTNLIIFDLGNNQLSGVIPSWIGRKFSSLRFLILRENRFFGRIPSSLCQLPLLQVLDIASNDLIDPIPHCFDNLKGMNQLADRGSFEYWEEVGATQTLKGIVLEYTKNVIYVNIDLSGNNLVGLIPDE